MFSKFEKLFGIRNTHIYYFCIYFNHDAMNLFQRLPDKGDPSSVLQVFPKFNIELLCCRYWQLQNWEFNELSFPYWRVYYNSKKGAIVHYKGIDYNLDPNKIIVIAPNTPYSTRLFNYPIPQDGYFLRGRHVNKEGLSNDKTNSNYILHLFIHFNLGFPYDDVNDGIYSIDVNDQYKAKLKYITGHLYEVKTSFNFKMVLTIQSLISDLLSELPQSEWNLLSKDFRILNTLKYIDQNPTSTLSNTILAKRVNLSTNSFNRLFSEEVGSSPQKYVKKKRINKACILLHHHDLSVEEIASHCGFANRYHFSRIFKQLTGFSPAQYRS